MAMSVALHPFARRQCRTAPARHSACWCWRRPTRSGSRPAWARTSSSASPNWRAPRCRGCAQEAAAWSSGRAYLEHVRVEKRLAARTVELYSLDLQKLADNAAEGGVALRGCRARTCAAGWRRCTAAAAAARGIALHPVRAGAASTPGSAGRAWSTATRCRTCARPRRQAAAQGAERRRCGAAGRLTRTTRPIRGWRRASRHRRTAVRLRPAGRRTGRPGRAWPARGAVAGSTCKPARRTCWARAASAAPCRWGARRWRRCTHWLALRGRRWPCDEPALFIGQQRHAG